MKKISKQPLKKLMKAHYAARSLSDAQLQALMSLQLDQCPEPSSSIKKYPRYHWLALGVLVLSLMLTNVWWPLTPNQNNNMLQSLVDEVSINHLLPFQLSVTSSSFDEVSESLNLLKFSLINSKRMDPERWTLIGGRYCSINGQLAAQLKLVDRVSQQVVTFYQTKITHSETPALVAKSGVGRQGVKVDVWQEQDVLLALAR